MQKSMAWIAAIYLSASLGVRTSMADTPIKNRWECSVHFVQTNGRKFSVSLILSIITGYTTHQAQKLGELGQIVGFLVGQPYEVQFTINGIPHYEGPPKIALTHAEAAKSLILAQYWELRKYRRVPQKLMDHEDWDGMEAWVKSIQNDIGATELVLYSPYKAAPSPRSN